MSEERPDLDRMGINFFTYFNSKTFRLFLISFVILFFELVCIRWLSSYVLYLGYFTNFVLLGSLLGIGAGALLPHHPTRLIKWMPIVVFVFLTIILLTRAQVNPQYENFVFFTSTVNTIRLPVYVLLPIIFVGVTAIFTLISQELGGLLNQFAPLKAYSLNILGSLAGIASFTIMSALSLPSWTWFLVVGLAVSPLLPRGRSFGNNLLLLFGIVAIIVASDYAYANIWSPYYRLNLLVQRGFTGDKVLPNQPGVKGERFVLFANGAGHQEFTTLEQSEPFYKLPYIVFNPKPVYDTVLVIGAGGGNDVAFALASGAQHVDAVEIDPHIAGLGRLFHPENPYYDPRVRVYIDDARSFLEKTDKKYDLIIFALPDSLVLAASTSNIRLESFLFTVEAFQSVKEHLQPDGLFVLYNYYRYEWLIQKISNMLTGIFGGPLAYHRYSDPVYEMVAFATIFAGSRVKEINQSDPGFFRMSSENYVPATDNWPFLYLKNPSLPVFYSGILAVILLFSIIYIRLLSPNRGIGKDGWPFFFMGAAFTLLEVRSIVQFFLLFGSTWIVNSLVFFAILFVVLIANWLASRYKFSKIWVLYGLLILSLLLNFFIPLKSFLTENPGVRYILASAFLFSPIFFANLIYSTTFRETKMANVAYGANLLGTMVGGATEYLSLLSGYQFLILLAGLFYILAFYAFRRTSLGQYALQVK